MREAMLGGSGGMHNTPPLPPIAFENKWCNLVHSMLYLQASLKKREKITLNGT